LRSGIQRGQHCREGSWVGFTDLGLAGQGYEAVQPLDDGWRRRLSVYRVLLGLRYTTIVVARMQLWADLGLARLPADLDDCTACDARTGTPRIARRLRDC